MNCIMSRKLCLAASLTYVTACSAAASPLDSANPTHCIAAFTYARTVALGGKPPSLSLAVQSTARSIFEAKKLQQSDGLSAAQKESEAVLAANASNADSLMMLVRECVERQDADPAFKSLNDSGLLMSAARRVDAECQADAACRSGKSLVLNQ